MTAPLVGAAFPGNRRPWPTHGDEQGQRQGACRDHPRIPCKPL